MPATDWADDLVVEMFLCVSEESVNTEMLSLYQHLGVMEKLVNSQFLEPCMGPSHLDSHKPKTVVPLPNPRQTSEFPELGNSSRPTPFVLVSTHPESQEHWTQTYQELTDVRFEVVPVLGIDGSKASELNLKKHAWKMTQTAWATRGIPSIR